MRIDIPEQKKPVFDMTFPIRWGKFITLERVDRPGVICASGGATTVWINFPRKKSVPLPDALRARIAG